jgi:hypothetical protein
MTVFTWFCIQRYPGYLAAGFVSESAHRDIELTFSVMLFSEDIVELLETAAELNWDLEIVNKKMTIRVSQKTQHFGCASFSHSLMSLESQFDNKNFFFHH